MLVAHWIAIGMFLTSLATQISGLQHGWRDAISPSFIAGVIMNIGSIAIALGTKKIGANNDTSNASTPNTPKP